MRLRPPADDIAPQWLRFWTERLGILRPVRLERTSIWHVIGENGRRGCSLVGVVLDAEEACIYHTRKLTQEDILHELLHVAHPDWSEEAVFRETARRTLVRGLSGRHHLLADVLKAK